MILYAVYAKTVRIETLFAGGLLPGLLMVAMVSAWGVYHGVKSGAARSRFSFAEARRALWAAKWELAVPVIVIVGLFGGIGTLVEAGAIAAAYSFVAECLILREFSLRRDFPRVAVECVTVVGGVLLIIGVAKGLTYYLAIQDVPGMLTHWVDLHIHSEVRVSPAAQHRAVDQRLVHGRLFGDHRDGAADSADCGALRHRSGADGRDLSGEPGTGLSYAAYRHELVPFGLPVSSSR